jgi:hypothetical protein
MEVGIGTSVVDLAEEGIRVSTASAASVSSPLAETGAVTWNDSPKVGNDGPTSTASLMSELLPAHYTTCTQPVT